MIRTLMLTLTCNSILGLNAQTNDYSGKDVKGIEAIVTAAVSQDDWRKEAYERIDSHRKADLNITLKDAKGNVLPNTEITLFQQNTTDELLICAMSNCQMKAYIQI